MEQAHEANAVMGGLTATPSGRLVVALPMAFSREIIAPHLGKFRLQHPEVKLEIIVTSHPVDIIRDQIDLAVVVGTQVDSDLIVKTIYQSELVWVTSPTYAQNKNLGNTKQDLLSHIQICEKRYAEKRFPIRIDGHKDYLDLSQHITTVNDPTTVREAVINGCGVSLLPEQYCKRQLADRQLVKVFQHIGFDISASALSVIYPSRRLISNKTRVFLDFLEDVCREI
jgi:DNA-binding transcriptional LysR family regulator